MNTTRDEQFRLTVRIGGCERCIETDGKFCHRIIKLHCPILSNSLKGENQPARGDEIDLCIYEATPDEEVIGSIHMLAFIELSLPSATFAEFWAASAAADGAARVAEVMQLFDAIIESSKTGIRKPNPRVYLMMCERLGVHPRACVYLDDLGINCKPAAQLGMIAIKVVTEDQTLSELGRVTGLAF